MENLDGFLNNKELFNIIDFDTGYKKISYKGDKHEIH